MIGSGWVRNSARVLASLGLAGAVVSLAAGPAAAASDLSVTRADGSDAAASTTTSHTCFKVVGTVPSSLSGTTANLSIVDPAGGSHSAGSATSSATQDGHVAFQFSTASLSWSDSCGAGGPVAPNGTYVAKLSGGVTSSVSFDVAVPPSTPQGFSGSPNGTVADFSWQRNAEESDFVGYDIADSSGRSVTGVMHPGDVCSGATCSVTVDFGSGAAGTSQTFTISALRSNGGGGQVRSGASSPATVNFPAPPPPPPSDSPSAASTASGAAGGAGTGASGGGTSGGSGSTSGSRSSDHSPRRVLSGKHPAADLRAYLPQVSAANAPNLPSVVTQVRPLPEGTYKPTLAYPDQVRQQKVRKAQPVTASVAADIVHVFDKKPLWRALAGAAVLFLVAAHLRAWLERVDASD